MSDQRYRSDPKALLIEPIPTLPGTVPECDALIAQLQAQIALRQERINLDSNNSSKPPSSDGLGWPNRAQRRASTKKRGAQPGHKGHSRSMVEEGQVDRIHDCRPQSVCGCGGSIIAEDLTPQRHQVFDVPPMKAAIDEYRLHGGQCAGCGKRHVGNLPVGVPRGQLGPRALSLIGVRGTRYHLTQHKIRHLLDQLMGLSFRAGAISQAHGKVSDALKAQVAEAVRSLSTASALWMDETHYRRKSAAH